MNRNMLMKLAISGFVLGITTFGHGTLGQSAEASSVGKPGIAEKSAGAARTALEKGKAGKAVGYAEAAVAASPRDAGYRALLGQAYLNDGRFASASTVLTEAMELGANDANTIIALSLAHIAQGKAADAVALLGAHRDTVPAPDAGLALALAGDNESAIYVLTEAARAEGASARTRQNLALAFALSGRWAQARILAAQDLSLAKVDLRMTEWAKLAGQPDAQLRVASLIGTKAKADAGMPVRLALANSADTRMAAAGDGAGDEVALAAADPAPVDSFAPPPPVLASADTSIRSVELPMPQRDENGVVPVTELPQPAAAPAEVIMADAVPYRAAPGAPAETVRPAQAQALELATRIVPAAFNAKKPDGWAVQLGAYDSLGIAKEKWGVLKKKNGMLASFPASSHAATVKGRTFYRLTVNGLSTRGDATEMCRQLKAQGQTCFIRQMGGAESIQWAAKSSPMRLASR
ncbi:Flp pilus assembly protein TadD [Sphingopyxis panaciterrae]|uniref:SPOR domain-containing protein n=1 Tax=Sphingopyxis panaciterrae TaxID=363841 RepID=UPI001422403E|nr:SPOR domain-containing protein [Sphingopyxis panaciterrae]NIJ36224.1 Flp pilus assembly protein TadD [Sphingopyxis panaciterrae]